MKKLFNLALGVVTSIGGFVEAGSISTAAQAGAEFRYALRVHLPLVASCVDKHDPCGRWHLPRLVLLAPRLNSGKPLSRGAVGNAIQWE
jgi:hypothetical protein